MLRALITSKIALALVAIVPWIAGEIALLQGCTGSCTRSTAAVEVKVLPEAHAPDCVIYETASGRLVTVKAPPGRIPSADCVRI